MPVVRNHKECRSRCVTQHYPRFPIFVVSFFSFLISECELSLYQGRLTARLPIPTFKHTVYMQMSNRNYPSLVSDLPMPLLNSTFHDQSFHLQQYVLED